MYILLLQYIYLYIYLYLFIYLFRFIQRVCKLERLVTDFRQEVLEKICRGFGKNLSSNAKQGIPCILHDQWRKRSLPFGRLQRSQAAAVVPGIAPARRCRPRSSRPPSRRGAAPHPTRMARCRPGG